MALYLVVAHQTAANPQLQTKLRSMASTDPDARFVLLVPATPVKHLLYRADGDPNEMARNLAAEAALSMRRAGLHLEETIVGAADPLIAIEQEFNRRRGGYAGIILSTLSAGVSRWLRRDLPTQVRSSLPGVPV